MGEQENNPDRNTDSYTSFLIDDILTWKSKHKVPEPHPKDHSFNCKPFRRVEYVNKEGVSQDLIPRKKMRTTFTGRQIYEMEKMFESKKYLNANERLSLSR